MPVASWNSIFSPFHWKLFSIAIFLITSTKIATKNLQKTKLKTSQIYRWEQKILHTLYTSVITRGVHWTKQTKIKIKTDSNWTNQSQNQTYWFGLSLEFSPKQKNWFCSGLTDPWSRLKPNWTINQTINRTLKYVILYENI